MAAAKNSDREIVVERVFDAPRALVWKAFTEIEHIDRWWGPNGFRNQTSSREFKEGGVWRYLMHGPDGKAWDNWIRYEEISPPSRLVYSHGGDGTDEAPFHVTVTFLEEGKGTRLCMRSVFPTAEACAAVKKFGVEKGGEQTMARLAGYLPYLADGSTSGAIVLTHLFDAPVEMVFAAWSTPAMLKRWWGPKHFTLPIVEVDFRVGGAYRMVMQDPAGTNYPFHGKYQEIVPNERIVFSAEIEGIKGPEVITTVTFTPDNKQTRLTVRQTIVGDPIAAEGQVEGWSGSLVKLDALLHA